jgi:hypothetical protein
VDDQTDEQEMSITSALESAAVGVRFHPSSNFTAVIND